MASESSVQKVIWLSLARRARAAGRVTLFRLNTGLAWLSALGPKGVIKLENGDVLIKAARPIALGFAYTDGKPVNGACDLPGWTTFHVTEELARQLVGRDIAIFTSIEAKRTDGGRTSGEQRNWMQAVHSAGGIAGVAKSAEEANEIIDAWREGRAPNLV